MDDALLERFLAALLTKGLAPSSVRLRKERLIPAFRHFRAHGVVTPAMLTAEDIDAFMAHLVEKGLRRETRKSYQTSLRTFGRWIADNGLVLVDPTIDLAPLSTDEAEELPPQPLTMNEAATLLASIPLDSVVGYRNRAMSELLYQCGLRLGEAVGLNLNDINLDAEIITVHGKGNKQRILPLLPSVILALRDYFALRRELLQGPDRGQLFLGEDGERLRNTAYRQWLIRHGKMMLGRERAIFPHLLRHSCAVHLLMGRADIRHVQELLGHADIDTTRIYLRLLPDELRTEYEAAMPRLLA